MFLMGSPLSGHLCCWCLSVHLPCPFLFVFACCSLSNFVVAHCSTVWCLPSLILFMNSLYSFSNLLLCANMDVRYVSNLSFSSAVCSMVLFTVLRHSFNNFLPVLADAPKIEPSMIPIIAQFLFQLFPFP